MNKILVVRGFWPTDRNPISGIFVTQQIKALRDAGIEVKVIVFRYVLKNDRFLTPEELDLPTGIRFFSSLSFRLPESLSKSRMALSFITFMMGVSISTAITRLFHADEQPSDGLRYSGVSAIRWARKLNLRTLLCIHGVDPFLNHPSVKKWVKSVALPLINSIHRVVLVGSPLRQHIEDIGLDIVNSVVVPNGTPNPETVMNSRYHENRNYLTLVSVSNLDALKGIDDNIRALHILNNDYDITEWRYNIIGDGPERIDLERMATSFDLQIRFLGRLPYKETMDEVANADIFSLPSWGEAFGIVYLEAMTRFKPTDGCLGNGAADIITDGKYGLLIPPKNTYAVAMALSRLFEDPELRVVLGKRARQTAEGSTWDANEKRVLDLLNLKSAIARNAL
ncbi:glycosyltransferase [Pseudochrobactrum kiredjianiae]|uniref:Glycosyltransferase n=1 Tax=Pseudochrobactrum kiredjianiae TaxID=386305 RepID=A0ABW3UZM9_9HYPH|nr:glycosyltransferase [Pseudochrobactrum kiredjianiae]MDM7852516.1 glycosyltransferase [Pseudochrobactrum kiredjianiae]